MLVHEARSTEGTAQDHNEITDEGTEHESVDLGFIQCLQVGLSAEEVHGHCA